MSKYFITGGSGFIGSNFIQQCINKNHTVLNFDLLTYSGNLDNLHSISKNSNYSFIKGDICDKDLLDRSLCEFKPNYIINFAAESHVDKSIDNPDNFINTNIVGTYKLLSTSLNYYTNLTEDQRSIFKFLHISTDEVYGSLDQKGLFDENSQYDPSSPYSASKAASDHLVSSWNKTYDLPTIITNCSNNYGPYQFPEKLIPHMIQRCLNEDYLPVYGDGKNIRDWIHVYDHCDAIYELSKIGMVGSRYNIGGSEEKANIEIVKEICNLLDELRPSSHLKSYNELIQFVEDRPGHDFRYAIDSSKIQNEIGWKPKLKFKDGLAKTVNWYLENQDWLDNIKNNKYKLTRIGFR
jgi:dTDP-glucose 4,6-dehydratase